MTQFLSYFHDPDNLFLPILTKLKNDIPQEVQGSIIAVTDVTTAEVKQALTQMGFVLVQGGDYGVGKRNALRESLKQKSADYYFVCDFDKFLHWILTDKAEFLELLATTPAADLTVVARGPIAFPTYPDSWTKTESIASYVIGKLLKQDVDVLNGPYILSKKAAEIILEKSIEDREGICAEWCILAHLNNLSISNVQVNGLTWEDPDRYAQQITDAGSYDKWKYNTFDSLYEWRKRIEILHRQVETMIRLLSEPENPKFPAVSNKVFDK